MGRCRMKNEYRVRIAAKVLAITFLSTMLKIQGVKKYRKRSFFNYTLPRRCTIKNEYRVRMLKHVETITFSRSV